MTIYLVNEHYNSGEVWEDNHQEDTILKAFDTKEKAWEFIKNIFLTSTMHQLKKLETPSQKSITIWK